jgi:uncharacterized protein (DUF2344 family)
MKLETLKERTKQISLDIAKLFMETQYYIERNSFNELKEEDMVAFLALRNVLERSADSIDDVLNQLTRKEIE